MSKRLRLSLAGLAAAVLLLTVVGAASATRLRVDDQDFSITWRGIIVRGAGIEVTCGPITIAGSFQASTFVKTAERTIGSINRASINGACMGGAFQFLTTETLPWQVRFESFTGRLPNITAIRVSVIFAGVAIQPAEPEGVDCLFQTSSTGKLFGDIQVTMGLLGGLTWDETRTIDTNDRAGSFACDLLGIRAEVIGLGQVEDGSGGTITLFLI